MCTSSTDLQKLLLVCNYALAPFLINSKKFKQENVMIKIAINGFGRIGKTFLRTILLDKNALNKIDVCAINIGPNDLKMCAHLFKYDSIMGTFPHDVSFDDSSLTINGKKISIIAECDPSNINWKKYGIDWVVESSGCFTHKEEASKHCTSGAKKVLITAPTHDEDITIIPGINDKEYDASKHTIISLGSCTTNCFAPMVKVILDNFTFKSGLMTTIHSYTNTQTLLDFGCSDERRSRAAATNIIPTNTGADKVIIKLFPELEGKINAIAVRVPIPVVSLVDFSFQTEEDLTTDMINDVFEKASNTSLKNILDYTSLPLVSSDFIGNPFSCIIDSLLTRSSGSHGKVFGWYDNEWGYSERLKDFLLHNS
jgi:glyceraldehyde 3-phosphate dehydrogenase